MNDPFERRRTLVLKRGKERVIANRHPWIFAGAIHSERGPEDAALGELVDGDGARLATGFYSSRSQIRLRALTFGDAEVTRDLIASRIAAAIARRRPILDETTNAARLVHAEGDELSSIVVDLYGDVLVVEIANRGAEQLKPLIAETLQRQLQPRVIFFKNDLGVREIEGLGMNNDVIVIPSAARDPRRLEDDRERRGGSFAVSAAQDDTRRSAAQDDTRRSAAQDETRRSAAQDDTRRSAAQDDSASAIIAESGLRFRVDPAEGQKTGFFLDQRENRRLARSLAGGKRFLNLFSYSGAFGVYAGAGGASSVTNVDVSLRAIDLARENHALNAIDGEHVVADAFQYVRQTRDRFDLVVCDPPAFAKSRGEVERAARGYKDINLYALRLVEPGGMLMTFSCSGHMSLDLYQKVIFAAALDSGRRVSFLRRLTAGPDHPVSLFCPEGEYLKGFLLAVQ